MDVQSVSSTLKPNFATTAATAGDSGSQSTAFSSLLQMVAPKLGIGANMVLAGLEANLMQSDTTPPPPPPQDDDDSDDTDSSDASTQSTTQSTDSNASSSNSSSSSTHATTASNQNNSTDHSQDPTQAQMAVAAQAAIIIQAPVVVQTQTAPTALGTGKTAVAAPTTGPVDPTAQIAAATPAVQQAVNTAANIQQAAVAAAPVVQQAAAPIAAPTQAAGLAAKALTTRTAQTSSTPDDDQDDSTFHLIGTGAQTQTTTAATTAPQQVTSTAAQAQASNLAQKLSAGSNVQVQVQTTTAPVTTPILTVSPYDHYADYTAPAEDATVANGQVGVTDPTNALVAPATATTAGLPSTAVLTAAILPPQLQSQAQQTTPTVSYRAEAAAAPIQALESSAGTQNNSQSQADAGAGFEAFSGANGTANTAATAKTANTQQPQAPVTAQQVIDQIKVNITRAAKAGVDKVSIQLNPEELGRIDVKLEMTDDQKVRVTVTADNKDTLNLLQSDSHTLERALNDAGLRTDNANLTFNLRSDSDSQQANQGQTAGGQQTGNSTSTADDMADDASYPTYDYGAAASSRGGVDTFA